MTTTTSYVCDLRNALDADEAGHKAANLAVLMRAGFPVPDSLVLLADALDHALDQAGLSPAASVEAVAAIDVPVEVGAALREAVRRWVMPRWQCGLRVRRKTCRPRPTPACTRRSSTSTARTS